MRLTEKLFRAIIAITGCLLYSLFLTGSVRAQQSLTATLEGIITDPNSAVIPNAKVIVKNTQTGQVREVQADESGIYRLSLLQPGAYEMTVSAPNFTDAKRSGITLTVGQKLNLDVALAVGGSSETINIEATAPLLETTRSNVAGSVGERQVSSLPVNGRNFLDFVTLTAGVVRDGSRQGDLSFGGQRGTFNSLQIDGVDNNNNFFGQALGRTGSGRAPYQFSQDAVQEFQVNTNSFSAEFGRAAGGAINVITKSGTNQFHGTAFEFFRDRSLNANSLRRDTGLENATRRPSLIPNGFRYDAASRSVIGRGDKPAYHFNQFGGNLGGPVKRDRAFFFFNYDGQRNTRPIIMALGAQAPTDAASQAGLQRVLPFIQNYTLGFDQDVYLAKGDWQLDTANRLGFRYNGQRFTGRNLENSGPTSAQEHTGNSNVRTNTYTVQLNTTFTPRLLNEFRTQIAHDNEPGIANSDNAEGNILQGGQTVVIIGRNFFSPRYTNEAKYQFVDNVSYFAGKHSLKGGVDFLCERIENFFPGNFGGRYFFQTANGYAEFANHFNAANAGYRRVTRFQQSFAGDGTSGALTNPDFTEYGFFVQDDWRAANRLTVNFGLRYDLQMMKAPQAFNPAPALAAAGLSTKQFNNDKNNWAPRFGFAWNPKQKWVVRGGLGLFFGRTPAIALGTAHSNNGVNVIGITLTNVLLPFVYPNRFPNLAAIQALGGQPAVPDIFIFDKNYQQPYTTQGSLGVEYALKTDITVGASYLYVKGTNLSRTRDLNLGVPVASTIFVLPTDTATIDATTPRASYLRHPGATAPTRPIAGFGRISQFEATGDSTYNALVLSLRKRFARHFQTEASYTWSKVLDNTPDQTSVVVGGGDDAKQAQYSFNLNTDRGRGVADVPHRFVLSGVWDLSYFNDLNGAAKHIVNGWELSGILQVAANQPLNEFTGADTTNDGNNRTDRTPGAGRNTLRVGRFQAVDLRLSKSVFLTEKVRLQFIGEFFNAFNRLNLGAFQSNRYRVTGLNTANAALVPNFNFLFPTAQVTDGQRIGQLAVKIIF
jgi:outer membrane receptor protein involved in Fe transport